MQTRSDKNLNDKNAEQELEQHNGSSPPTELNQPSIK
jgi:hypothetical protein